MEIVIIGTPGSLESLESGPIASLFVADSFGSTSPSVLVEKGVQGPTATSTALIIAGISKGS